MDSITFNGIPFTVLPPDAAHKVLGVFMALTGSYWEQKEYGMAKMKKRCKAQAEDFVIPRGGSKNLQSPAALYQYSGPALVLYHGQEQN